MMVIRIKFPDGELKQLKSGSDDVFIDLYEGDEFDMPDDFPREYRGKYIVERRISDESPLENLGDILEIRRLD